MFSRFGRPIYYVPTSLDGLPYSPPIRGTQGAGLGDILAVLAIVGGAVYAVISLLEEPRPRRRRRPYNDAPLRQEDREYVSVRDGWRCTFCGRRVSRHTRHIDHSVSRANGGTNHINNLRLACPQCNLSKGPLNGKQFRSY